ncbi:MAG: hypothetical protein ACK55I_04045, partial [bacterium]
LLGLLAPQLADLRARAFALAVGAVEVVGAAVERDLAAHVLAETFHQRLAGHVDPAPDLRDLFPCPGAAVAEVLPVDVVHRGALVLDLLGHLRALGEVAVLVNVFGDLRAVLG